jgi:DNA-binding MarR family transcriptional regulator
MSAYLKTTIYIVCAGSDYTDRQKAVLGIAAEEDQPETVRGLAHRLKVSKPAITRATDKLVKNGLVKRVTDPQDRRSVLISVSASGRKEWAKIQAIHAKAELEAA